MEETEYIDIGDFSSSQIKRTLFVSGLDGQQVNIEVLYNLFETFGEIRNVDIPVDRHTNMPRGFAFVEFADLVDAKEAQINMDGSLLFGRTLNVNFARALNTEDKSRARSSSIDRGSSDYLFVIAKHKLEKAKNFLKFLSDRVIMLERLEERQRQAFDSEITSTDD